MQGTCSWGSSGRVRNYNLNDDEGKGRESGNLWNTYGKVMRMKMMK